MEREEEVVEAEAEVLEVVVEVKGEVEVEVEVVLVLVMEAEAVERKVEVTTPCSSCSCTCTCSSAHVCVCILSPTLCPCVCPLPAQVPIANAEEVEQVFDAISYCKGGSVVRMVHAVVGKEKFVQGLRAYMDEFKYGNATTGDLWKAWELASGKPVTDMMGQWTTQMGFPLLEVVEAAAAAGGVTLKLKQSWFLADGSAPAPGEEKLWMIPVFATA